MKMWEKPKMIEPKDYIEKVSIESFLLKSEQYK